MDTFIKRLFSKAITSTKDHPVDTSRNRLIFCINSGRSGSNYLADLLGSATDVTSYHEAYPPMTGKYLRMINKFPYEKSFKKRCIKCRAIKNILSEIPANGIYCETNHMFIKTFFDVVLQDFENVEVIILRRELASVLKSFIELNYFSSQNKVWPDWMSLPDAKTAAIPCIAPYKEMDHYDRCIAYLIDIEARAQRFKKDYSWIKVHEVRIEPLNNTQTVSNLFNELQITFTEKTKTIVGRKINKRSKRKEEFNTSSTLAYCNERISQYIYKARRKEILIPEKLALSPYTCFHTIKTHAIDFLSLFFHRSKSRDGC